MRGVVSRIAPSFAVPSNTPHLAVVTISNQYAEVTRKIYSILDQRMIQFFSRNHIGEMDTKKYILVKEDIKKAVAFNNAGMPQSQQNALTNDLYSEYQDITLALTKAKFVFAENIAVMERFQLSEFVDVDSSSITREGFTLVAHEEYPGFAMALAKNEPPPRRHGAGGILSAKDYRNVVSSNLWLYAAEKHDLKHMHFAHAHPMASVSFFRAARSKNHLRFILIAGMQEGVDTVQYAWETDLSRRYQKLGYTLEHAMTEIASMNQKELVALATEVRVGMNTYNNWKPVKVNLTNRPANASDPTRYESDLIRFIEKSVRDLRDPSINIFMRPEMIPEGMTMPAGTSAKPGERLH